MDISSLLVLVGILAILAVLLTRREGSALSELRREIASSSEAQRREMSDALRLVSDLNMRVDTKIAENTRHLSERLDRAAALLADTKSELGKVTEIRGAIEHLNVFLRGGKKRGNLGEEGMKELLLSALPKESVSFQHGFRTGEKVDALVQTHQGGIPIDSKFPLEAFEHMQKAQTDAERESHRKAFIQDVKKHIDAIAGKYIRTDEGTVDFAVMYIPAESVHYEAAIVSDEVSAYARTRRVHLVSPSGLFYFLRVVLIALQSQKFEENALRVLSLMGGIQKDAAAFGEMLDKAAKQVTHAKVNMDEAVQGFGTVQRKIEHVSAFVTVEEGVLAAASAGGKKIKKKSKE